MPNSIRPELLTFSSEQFQALAPYAWVLGGTIVAMILSVVNLTKFKWPVYIASILTCLAGIIAAFGLIGADAMPLFNGMMIADGYSNLFHVVFLASAAFTMLASFRYLDKQGLQHAEYYLLILFSAFGMMMMASSLDLIVLFIALELMSIVIYVLVGFRRADRRSNEGAMKYFILGSAASAVLLYGTALMYGVTASTNITDMLKYVQANPSGVQPIFTLGAWLVMIGFLFKVATVPFHMWMPDVYEGAPTPITGFMTTGLKAAAFAAFLRFFMALGYGKGLAAAVEHHIHDILWVVALATMLIGNLSALVQTNLKRMLAYSSIAHSGYLLVGLIAGSKSDAGYAPVVMYLVSYAVMNLGAFVVLTLLSKRDDSGLNLHDLSGLASRRPWLAFAMSVFLLSMAGIPPTAGFAAKYLLFYSAVQAGEIWLVVLSVLCSAISVYYYLRVLVHMYMREATDTAPTARLSIWASAVVAIMVALTFQIGVLPGRMMSTARKVITKI